MGFHSWRRSRERGRLSEDIMFGIYEMQKRLASGYAKRLSDQQIAAVRNSRARAPAGDPSSSHPSASTSQDAVRL